MHKVLHLNTLRLLSNELTLHSFLGEPTMSTQSHVSTGVIHDIFILLSRPATQVSVAFLFASGLLFGLDADHPLLQVSMVMLWGSLLARAVIANRSQRWPLIIMISGLAILFIGFINDYQRAGTLKLTEGIPAESYQRGRTVEVDYHLGGSLRLTMSDDQALFEMIGKDRIKLPQDKLIPGAIVEIDQWRLSLQRVTKDSKKPSARLTVTPRLTGTPRLKEGKTQTVQLSSGQSKSPDGQTLITALNISGDRGGPNAPHLGAGVELLLKWGEKMQRGWYYVNPPDLDERWGESPLVLERVEIIPSSIYHWRVQQRSSSSLMIFALILLGIASLFTIIIRRES